MGALTSLSAISVVVTGAQSFDCLSGTKDEVVWS